MTPSQPVSTISSPPFREGSQVPRRPRLCPDTRRYLRDLPPSPRKSPVPSHQAPSPRCPRAAPAPGEPSRQLEYSPHPIPTWDTMKPFVYSVRSRKPCSCGELILGLRPNRAPGRPSCAECGSVSRLRVVSRSLPLPGAPCGRPRGSPGGSPQKIPLALLRGRPGFRVLAALVLSPSVPAVHTALNQPAPLTSLPHTTSCGTDPKPVCCTISSLDDACYALTRLHCPLHGEARALLNLLQPPEQMTPGSSA